jgi:hypothetical protein
MTEPPEDPAECARIGDELWIALRLMYQGQTSKADLDLLNTAPANGMATRQYLYALGQFHEFILEQFAQWGWRMLLSRDVLRILAQWESLNPQALERLGKAFARKSRTFRGETSANFPKGIEVFADEAIVELKRLLRVIRNESHRRGPPMRCDRIAEMMKAEIESKLEDFPRLAASLGQLHGYVALYLPSRNKKAATLLESGEMRADIFFYQFLASARRTDRHKSSLKAGRSLRTIRCTVRTWILKQTNAPFAAFSISV